MIGRIIVSVAISAVVVVLFAKMMKTRTGALAVIGLSTLGFIPAFFVWLPLVLQMVGSFWAGAICLVANPRRSVAVGLLGAVVALAYGFGVWATIPEMLRLERLRQEFPLESLAGRLDYEQRPELAALVAEKPHLVPAVGVRLEHFEEQDADSYWSGRIATLRALHGQYHDGFVMATGNGPPRMMQIYRDEMVLDDLGPVVLPRPQPSEPDSAAGDPPGASASPGPPLPGRNLLAKMHESGINDLLDRKRFGYVADRAHVAGFQAHRFTRLPEPADDPNLRWTLVRLELIGLLKYDRPKAYVSENLPRLEELGEAATRDIDPFETAALERLRTEEDLVIDEAPERIRMLGSLRAGKQCLECHSVQRGQLLGALSYEIVPRDNKQIVAAQD